jgi:hypothetical protein
MVCLGNICINTLQKGAKDDDDDNNNNTLQFGTPNAVYPAYCLATLGERDAPYIPGIVPSLRFESSKQLVDTKSNSNKINSLK